MALAALLGALACAGWWLPQAALDWQPGLAGTQPWRAFSAIAVHYSALHLAANLAGAVLVGALGWAGALPPRCALAWALAWPLTQFGLLLQPELAHYGGLSGVLHAGVAVAGLHLIWHARGRRRAIGIALLGVMAVKLIGESPWGAPLRHPVGWDIAVAPLAHASGAVAGLLVAALIEAWTSRRP
jgi:rhomboid family GlyGly-CTERM serine protease